jgi:hypothetical protein
MKKFALFALLAAALAVPSIAAAATPQVKLTGSAVFSNSPAISVTTPIIDGGTSYVGLENDRSGTCAGDSGQVDITLPVFGIQSFPVECANYVTSSRDGSGPKMRFAVLIADPSGGIEVGVYRISDNGSGPDKAAVGSVHAGNLTTARQIQTSWVNTGAIGSGHASAWQFQTLTSGDFTIAAAQ